MESKKKDKNKDKDNIKIDKASFVSYKTNNISKDYTLGKTLGQGSFGTVRKAIHKATKQERAIKILKKSGQDEEKFFLEVNILSKLTHPNIMHIYEFYEDKANYYIVSELCKGGELFDMITEKGCFNESEACPLMHQLMSAICYCHQNRIVHRDLKPENILLEDKNRENPVIKLIDWGGARYFSKHKKMSKVNGTPYYIAPEVLNEVYDEKCDIWSAGVILYIIICGYPCFNGENDDEIFAAIQKGKIAFPSPEWDDISEDAKELIKKMCCSPSKRLTASQVLNETWVKDNAPKAGKTLLPLKIDPFKTYSNSNKLRKAVLTYIASRLSEEEIKKIKAIFQSIDVDNDGKLSLEEMKKAVSLADGMKIDYLEQLFKSIDTDNSGNIEYTEFISASIEKSVYLNEEKLKDAFKLFDADNSGKISRAEIEKVLHMDKHSNEINAIMDKHDINKDGEIDFEEFLGMMKDLS